MTYGEIEFLDEPDPPSEGDVAGQPAGGYGFLVAVPVLGWLAAAVLAVFAPFRAVYTFGSGQGYVGYVGLADASGGVDGWGRSLLPGPDPGGVRFGIALVGCGALFAAMGVLTAVAVARAGRGRPGAARLRGALTAGAIGTPCLLVGVVAALGLYIRSATRPPALSVVHAGAGLGSYVQLNAATGGVTYSSSLSVSTDNPYSAGGCLWLALGALGCAVVAAITCLVAYRTLAAVDGSPAASGRL